MKKMAKYIAGLLCVCLCACCLGACSLVEVDETKDNARIAAKIEDRTITKGEWKSAYAQYASLYGITDEMESDPAYSEQIAEIRNYVLDMLVNDEIGLLKMEEAGITLTAEEDAEVRAAADAEMDNYREMSREYWEEQAKTDSSINVEAQVEEDTKNWFELNGYGDDGVYKAFLEDKKMQLFMDRQLQNVTVSDDDVNTYYDTLVTEQKEAFQTAGTYDYYTAMGETVVYRPAGYVQIKQILLKIDEDTSLDLVVLRSEKNDAQADQVRDEGLKKIKDRAQEVLAKVKAGEDFDALMAQYNEDEGLKEEPYKTEGYTIGEHSYYAEELIDAALSLKNPGDTTELVASDSGYHIVKLLKKHKEGAIPFEDVEEEIRKTVLDEAKADKWVELIEGWKKDFNVQCFYNVWG